METLLFYIFAVIIIGSASVVVTSRNIMYSAFALLFTFFGVAAFYVLLNADFIAVTQIMIYIGGILVLIIFGVMLTTNITGVDMKEGVSGKTQLALGGIAALSVAVTLIMIFRDSFAGIAPSPEKSATVKEIGQLLLTDYLLAFEVASVLLLIAIVGAALIARRKKIS